MDRYREHLERLLRMRKDLRYRQGLIQGFRSCDKITQEEWESLHRQVLAKVKEPKL